LLMEASHRLEEHHLAMPIEGPAFDAGALVRESKSVHNVTAVGDE
jgi:hypothetical protein